MKSMPFDKVHSLYCDGGVIGKNPSELGGTWAFCLVSDIGIEYHESGVVLPKDMGTPVVTNNQTEMLALLNGLLCLPDDFAGTVYSDSNVTLGRVFGNYAWNNIPAWMNKMYIRAMKCGYSQTKHCLISGHPTKKQLELGIGKGNRPVSKYNVWCDQECTRLAQMFLAEHENIKE